MGKKEIVRLREKAVSGGRKSLYLDIYMNGVRSYEFLKLYVVEEKTREDKNENKRIYALAEAIKSKRIVEIQNDEYGFNKCSKGADFIEWILDYNEKDTSVKQSTKGTRESFISKLRKFKKSIKFSELNNRFSEDFYSFLLSSGVSVNTANMYFTKYKYFVSKAFKYGLIKQDLVYEIPLAKGEAHERKYLTMEELKMFASSKVEKRLEGTKRMFLFSCMTGLRYSDVSSLKWSDFHKTDDGRTRIVFGQKKTRRQEYLDINESAVEFAGDVGDPDELVFKDAPKSLFAIGFQLSNICRNAGIKKHITFHCSRHTFAVMMIELDVDIYTVSKLLGHSDVKTTQTYAKIVDKRKRDAVDLIPKIM